jgi:hypothetical protein
MGTRVLYDAGMTGSSATKKFGWIGFACGLVAGAIGGMEPLGGVFVTPLLLCIVMIFTAGIANDFGDALLPALAASGGAAAAAGVVTAMRSPETPFAPVAAGVLIGMDCVIVCSLVSVLAYGAWTPKRRRRLREPDPSVCGRCGYNLSGLAPNAPLLSSSKRSDAECRITRPTGVWMYSQSGAPFRPRATSTRRRSETEHSKLAMRGRNPERRNTCSKTMMPGPVAAVIFWCPLFRKMNRKAVAIGRKTANPNPRRTQAIGSPPRTPFTPKTTDAIATVQVTSSTRPLRAPPPEPDHRISVAVDHRISVAVAAGFDID